MAIDSAFDGNIEPRELADEMRSAYLDYAMSVIVGRALPDVRDGLKPVHRRVLYAMDELGLAPNRPYVKCAKVVGETMGTYHPHGDQSIYDTLVRLAQPFASRAPLVDGQGNFGNVDGFQAAAMRYTECRLAPIATQMLRDLDANTVDFVPNYDASKDQPAVLPARFPNLLVNGSSGIAVGMATNIPPHNLGEAINACVAFIDDPTIGVDGLMQHLRGPDFPTGGLVMGLAGVREAYETGRGRIRLRARTEVEELAGGRHAIVVTELPYTVRKGGEDGVIARIAQLAVEKVLPEVADVKDHSSDAGMRIVIELKRGEAPEVVLNKLYRHTPLQFTFGANMVALVENVPRTLGLVDLLRHYVAHQKDVVTRRTKFLLERAERRAHVLEGYLIALDDLDAVIALIRASADADTARAGLQDRFGLSEVQAQAILDLRLQRLTGLEQSRIREEHAELVRTIAEYRAILGDESRVLQVVRDELVAVRDEYADARRTEIATTAGDIDDEALIPDDEMVVSITGTGYAKRVPLDAYRQQRRGGVGVMGMETKDDDWIQHLFIASAHDYLLFFTSAGRVYRLKAYQLQEATRQARGRALVNHLPLRDGETVRAVFRTRDYSEGRYLVFGTRDGIVKKTLFSEYDTRLKNEGIIALGIRPEDELVDVRLADPGDDILLVSRNGMAVRFPEGDVRAQQRPATGVRGMRLHDGDAVISLRVPRAGRDVLVVTELGFGKRTPIEEYRRTRRGGSGIRTIAANGARGALVAALAVEDADDVIVITEGGILSRMRVGDIGRYGRRTQGVRIQRLREEDRVAAVAVVREPEEVAEGEAIDVVPPQALEPGTGATALPAPPPEIDLGDVDPADLDPGGEELGDVATDDLEGSLDPDGDGDPAA